MSRAERVEELIREEVCEILRERVSDPRIGFVSITGVNVSPDLENASIYVSILGEEKKKQEAMEGLYSATGFIRGELGHRLDMRVTPGIRFIRDDSIERGSNVLKIMKELADEKRVKRVRKVKKAVKKR